MSETDSFIDEVSEEVRRDRLYATLRRYGWIAAVVVVIVVGGAAWNEFRKAQAQSKAEAFGDAIMAALESADASERASALASVTAEAPGDTVMGLLVAAEREAAEDPAAAAEALTTLAARTDVPTTYTDLAALKLVLLGEDGVDETTRSQLLQRVAAPGAPYRLVGLELQAVSLAAAGEADAARTALESFLQEPGLSQAMVQRATQLLLVLGPANSEDAG